MNLFPRAAQRGAALLKLAGLAAVALELSRDLKGGGPVRDLRQFLEKVAALPPGHFPEVLQKALKAWGQAATNKARTASSPSLALVEEVLARWDLQPKGLRSVEAAIILADLLKKHGLLKEAPARLARWRSQIPAPGRVGSKSTP